MPNCLVLLITVISCSTVWSFETLGNTTEGHTNSNSSQTETTLLYGRAPPAKCMRLFSFYRNRDYWIDLCDSNPSLSPFLKKYTRAVCSPRSTGFNNIKYWVVYSHEYFRGRYILVQPDTCITVIRRRGMRSVGSIMKCSTWSGNNVNSPCNIPRDSTKLSDESTENTVDEVSQETDSGDESPDEVEPESTEDVSGYAYIIAN